MDAVEKPWNCPNCKDSVSTAFCPQCGERALRPLDLTLRSLFGKLLHATTSIDGRLLRTVARLLRRPGSLTLAYIGGERKPYIAPFQLFLLTNVLFFAVQSLTGTNIFSPSLQSQMQHQDWSALAQSLVAQRLDQAHTTLEIYASHFDRAVVLYAKSLIILMVMPFALLVALLFLPLRKPFITHVVFSLHLYAFLLLLFSVAILIVAISELTGGPGLNVAWVDNVLSVANLLACGAYIFASTGPVFGARGPVRVLRVVALTVVAGAIVLGYRFVVFLITLYLT